MTDNEKELMLDLLVEKFVYGLSDEDSKKLEGLGYEPAEAESIELTIATLGMVDLPAEDQMPAHLYARLKGAAGEVIGAADAANAGAEEPAPREIVLSGRPSGSWFGWLGWAAAAAASIALAVSLFIPRGGPLVAGSALPTPTPEVRPDPARERQEMMRGGGIVVAEWGKGNVDELASVSGDVVWSDQKQAGYMRFRGLPKNDTSKETYQLWIFDETQDPKTPIDGGTFDITSDGEVIVPIDAKLKAKNPSAFAITIEKPGGVVVSKREKIASLAAVKPKEA
ncbi:MAG: anti-sigma factor [Pyrinomonadaceae bacterium]